MLSAVSLVYINGQKLFIVENLIFDFRSVDQTSYGCLLYIFVILVLKTGLNEFPLSKTKRIKVYTYASVIRKKYKEKYLCSFK